MNPLFISLTRITHGYALVNPDFSLYEKPLEDVLYQGFLSVGLEGLEPPTRRLRVGCSTD